MKKVKIGTRHHFVNTFAAEEIEKQRDEIKLLRSIIVTGRFWDELLDQNQLCGIKRARESTVTDGQVQP